MKTSQRIAFCGMVCALAIVVLMATVFPYATYALAALAGIVMIAAALELGTHFGLLCYAVTALLALLITPDPEAKLLFVLFFGYYPTLQLRLNLWQNRALTLIVKFAVFNAAVIAAFFLAVYVMGVPQDSFTIGGVYLPWVLLILGNIVFVVFDVALTRVSALYRVRIHPIVKKIFKF